MTIEQILIVILICALIWTNCGANEYFSSKFVVSPLDNQKYSVVADYDDNEHAAILISQINTFTKNLISKLKSTYLDNPSPNMPELERRKGAEVAKKLLSNYNPKELRENDTDNPNETSYTQNKGDFIALCLREKDSGKNQFQDIHTILFVQLHEISHIITPEMDHTPKFWANFRFLLKFCKKNNLYDAPNYRETPKKYCGMEILYHPMYDNSLQDWMH